MKFKKIILIILLLAIISGIVVVVVTSGNKNYEDTKTSAEEKNNKADIVMQDNYFITQINDIYINYEQYLGKTIEIEGFPMSYQDLKFVGRYGPGCCVNDGYAYLEYETNEQLELVDEKDWIKVKGTIEKGFDGSQIYIYIKATSIEKMDTRGNDTVST